MASSNSPVPTFLSLLLLLACSVPSALAARGLRLHSTNSTDTQCAVIFDAGSTGSRVHVYCFDANLDLVNFGDGYELFLKTSPGLSSYAADPEAGAESLRPLLNAAIEVVPEAQRAETPVRLGATAGLRLLPGDAAENLLEAVSNLLEESPFKFQSDWVGILDGTQEGGFSWVSINYLLGNIGQPLANTVGMIDLGGGSVQMSYGISDDVASSAPEGDEEYVTDLTLLGTEYQVYVHSYLHYGLLAGRAEILKLTNESASCPCIAKDFEGEYVYDSVTYKAVGSIDGADLPLCRKLILEALDITHSCEYSPCTFGGVWSGGGGDGQKNLYVASYFFDRALQAGIIADANATEAEVRPADFGRAAREVCKLNAEEIGELYLTLSEEDLPYFCLDLAYQYYLLVEGFGLDKGEVITLVKQITYKGSPVEAQWTLGCAIDAISSSSTAQASFSHNFLQAENNYASAR